MKRNEIKDLKSKTKEELYLMLKKLKSEVANFQVYKTTGKSKAAFDLSGRKKDIARVLTFIQKKEIESL